MSERDIFLEALNQPDRAARAAYLASACAANDAMRQRIEELLRCHECNDSLLDRRPEAILTTGDDSPEFVRELSSRDSRRAVEGVGATIAGRYLLVEVLGEGGMGTVFRATQTEPVKRDVALKLIRAGMLSPSAFARFEMERQTLASMSHPNIARVYDGGTTPLGQPFLVMELVTGPSITDYCDSHRLSPVSRLRLFVSVCRAVQHAHQRGIIHCDLKPSNILVGEIDGRATPTVIDFGVARANEPAAPDSGQPRRSPVIGTLAYMAPEQANPTNNDIDTRADTYALGVVLYELLVGTTPLDPTIFHDVPIPERLRLVNESERPRPSTRLQTSDTQKMIAASRGTEPGQLATMLRGELDCIVMKALERDRGQRYQSANDLADDIERYLNGEVVRAVPATTVYRLRKFLSRNPIPVIAVSLIVMTLLLGVTGTTWGMWKAERARQAEAELRRQADEAAEKEKAARELAEQRYVQIKNGVMALCQIFVDLNPAKTDRQGQPLAVILGKRLDRVAEDLDKVAGDPLASAAMHNLLGQSQIGLDNPDKAMKLFAKAAIIYSERLGPDHPSTLAAQSNLGLCYRLVKRTDEAIGLLTDTLQRQQAVCGPDHKDTLHTMNNLALAYGDAGQRDMALSLHEQAAKRIEAKYGADHPLTLAAAASVATSYYSAGKREQALPLLEQSFVRRKTILGPTHPDTMLSMNNLAVAYQALGKFDLAIPLFEETMTQARQRFGPSHADTIVALHNLAGAYFVTGKREAALPLFEELVKQSRVRFGPTSPRTLQSMTHLANTLAYLGQFQKAAEIYEEVLARQPDARSNIESLIRVYEDLERSSPGNGHQAKAAQWKARLKALTPAPGKP
jgi:serine/threonine protein kinase/tetratricopeptide (TPR) repeat protein